MLRWRAGAFIAVAALMVARPQHAGARATRRDSSVLIRRGGAAGKHGRSVANAPYSQPASLFGPNEEELDRYSAALAGTHFLRQQRDQVMKETINSLAYLYLALTKRGQYNRWMSSPWVPDEARQAQKNYLVQAGNIIRSNGLTTARYNELSHVVGKQKDLRKRVQQQAYLYRVNADLGGEEIYPVEGVQDKQRSTSSGAGAAKGMGNQRRQVASKEGKQGSEQARETMLFAKSLKEIETLRLRMLRRLMLELGCDELPPGICQPSMERIAPRFRKACESFPLGAESLARANGLGADNFNRLSAKTRSNAFYRWQVLRCIHELDKNREKNS